MATSLTVCQVSRPRPPGHGARATVGWQGAGLGLPGAIAAARHVNQNQNLLAAAARAFARHPRRPVGLKPMPLDS